MEDLGDELHECDLVSDIAIFVLKRDVKLQPTNQHECDQQKYLRNQAAM